MIFKSSSNELALDHRAYYMASCETGLIVLCHRTGSISIVDGNREISERFDLNRNIKDVSLAPDGDKLAIVFHNRLEIRSPNGTTLGFLAGAFESAFFDDAGRLWTASASGTDTIRIQVFKDLQLAVETSVADPFGGSAVSFPNYPRGFPIPLWVAAGQDGQTIYWLKAGDRELEADRMDQLNECGPPTVSNWADEFLIFTDTNILRRYSLHDCELLSEAELLSTSEEDHGFGLDIVCISAEEALVCFEPGRIYLVDLISMSIQHEVVLEGHEPRPTRELYPSLNDDELCSDVSSVFSINGQIVSLHTQLPDKELRQHGTLAWWTSNA